MLCMNKWLLLAAGVLQATVAAETWTQYRGSNHNGASTEPIRIDWAQQAPRTLWKIPLPFGLSSFSVANNRLYTMGWRRVGGQDREFCLALDATTGAEVWAAPVGLADYPHGGVGSDDGPRSTPTVDGNRVYAFGSYMGLVCLDAATGAEIWRRELGPEFGAEIIPWENAASPTLVGDLVFVNSNGRSGEHLIAFRKTDGAVAWKHGSYGMTHATPVLGSIGGVEQILFLAQRALVAVRPETGAVLWEYPLRYNGTSVAASPVIVGNTVYISRAYPGSLSSPQAGALVLEVSSANGSFSAARKWEKVNQLMNHWATPVYYNGHYYGIYGQGSLTLRCIDAANGDSKWQISGFGYGSVVLARDKLIVLGDDGDLVLVDPQPEQYVELARIKPLDGRCWNNLAMSDGRIYARSTTEAVALDVSTPDSVPPPPLKIGLVRSLAGSFTLEVAAENGTPIESPRSSRISIYARPDIGNGAAWERVTNSTVLSQGKLTLDLSNIAQGQRYFRTEEPE